MPEHDGTSLVDAVDHLRGLAQLSRDVSVLEWGILNVLAQVAAAVDQLTRGEA